MILSKEPQTLGEAQTLDEAFSATQVAGGPNIYKFTKSYEYKYSTDFKKGLNFVREPQILFRLIFKAGKEGDLNPFIKDESNLSFTANNRKKKGESAKLIDYLNLFDYLDLTNRNEFVDAVTLYRKEGRYLNNFFLYLFMEACLVGDLFIANSIVKSYR